MFEVLDLLGQLSEVSGDLSKPGQAGGVRGIGRLRRRGQGGLPPGPGLAGDRDLLRQAGGQRGDERVGVVERPCPPGDQRPAVIRVNGHRRKPLRGRRGCRGRRQSRVGQGGAGQGESIVVVGLRRPMRPA
ncbi:MAG: hypothetical protein QJR07_21985 [Acetobacteraceae bacterium]|nr:hypothetical protein [Acetobacteraceae bacterium]